MLSFRPFLVVLATIAASVAAGGVSAIAQDLTSTTVTTSYDLAAKTITLHEPVTLIFRLSNRTSQAVKVDLGQDRKGSFSFVVTGPDGVRRKLPAYSREGIGRIGRFSIKPGETYSQNILLNEWYDFPSPGEYQLAGQLMRPITLDDGVSQETDPGFRITLEISPRDEVALTKRCDALASLVERTNSSEEALDATLALSHVNDPIAVAYLRRTLVAQKSVEPIAITGLERIADDAAVTALAEATKSQSVDTARLARASLDRIEKRTNDAQIRQRIEGILSQR